MEEYIATMFQDVRQKRSFLFLLSLTDPHKIKQSNFTDHEISIIKNLALEKLTRQRVFLLLHRY